MLIFIVVSVTAFFSGALGQWQGMRRVHRWLEAGLEEREAASDEIAFLIEAGELPPWQEVISELRH